jgi:hypothetical protein
LGLAREIVPDSTSAYHEDNSKRLSDFGSYVSRDIAFPILVVTELRPAHARFCGQVLLRDPGCLPSISDLPPEFSLPGHGQYIDSIEHKM